MPRTVNEQVHALRRDEFLDAAQRLLESKGYERMSVQDVLDALGASRGAFYHYFDSKQALLEAVIERIAEAIAAHLDPIVREKDLSALDKLSGLFAGLAGWKAQRRELLVALLPVWYSDDNAIVRQKLRARMADRLAPLLTAVIGQGVQEGVFTAAHPDALGRVVVSLIQDLNDRLGDLFLAFQVGRARWPTVEDTVAAYTGALERILGVPTATVVLVQTPTLRSWFDPEPTGDGAS